MSTRAQTYSAQVLSRTPISPHLVRLELGGDGLAEWASAGIADEWVGFVVPGQFQSRYYTVRSHGRSHGNGVLTLDVVVHDVGLVTEWAKGECVGDVVTITEPKGSFAPEPDAAWLMLVGDLTALPAMARIAEETALPTRIWAEVPDTPEDLAGYLPDSVEVTWLEQPADGVSHLAEVTADLTWPEGEGYFWMAGESAQMRAIRKHLMRDRKLPSSHYDVMGYWRSVAARQPRAVERSIGGA